MVFLATSEASTYAQHAADTFCPGNRRDYSNSFRCVSKSQEQVISVVQMQYDSDHHFFAKVPVWIHSSLEHCMLVFSSEDG